MGVKVQAPDGCGSFGWQGQEFSVNKKGVTDVPVEALADLASHGILPVEDQAAE